jgi:cell division protein FtsB
MTEQFASIVIPTAIAFLVALGTLFLARKAGLSEVDAAVREQRGALVATLSKRVEHLENENRKLQSDIDYLRHENEQLRTEVARLSAQLIKLSIHEAARDARP